MHVYGIDLKNDNIIKIVKFEAFPIISRPNKGAHRVLRSILDRIRPVGRTSRNVAFFFWKLKIFFLKKRPFPYIRKALNVLTNPQCKKNFFK